MAPLLRASACLLLTVAYTLAAVAPCQPVFEGPANGSPAEARAERVTAWDAAGAEEPQTSIAAACPCGCEKKSPVRTGAGAGFALSRVAPEPACGAASFEVAFAPPSAPVMPDPGIDPIPV